MSVISQPRCKGIFLLDFRNNYRGFFIKKKRFLDINHENGYFLMCALTDRRAREQKCMCTITGEQISPAFCSNL